MKKFQSEYKIAQLISKEITGEFTPEESAILQQWLDASKKNRKLYETIKQGDRRRQRDQYVKSINTQNAWRKIGARINTKGRIKRMPDWMERSAAILIIALLAGTAYFVTRNTKTQSVKIANTAIQPGSSKAVLLLGNGKAIQLESVKSDSILEKDGTIITNTNGKLAYTVSTNKQLKTIYNVVKVPRGGEYHITLSDGTKVWLNSESQIKYPVQFAGTNRKVWIDGEVYFDVEKNKDKPFIVGVKDIEVEVLGTEFNIEAYSETDLITTTLIEGSVKLTKASLEQVIINPNQQAVIRDRESTFTIHHVDASTYALWKEGIIYSDGEKLELIMNKLARWYDANIFYMNPSLKSKRFNIEVKRYEDVGKVLEILAATDKVRFEVHDNNIIIKENK